MAYIKKILITATAIAGAICSQAATRQALTLHMESGAAIVYFLDTEPKIGFSGQTMIVSVNGTDTDIPMQEVNHWEIGMADDAGIDTGSTVDIPKITVSGNEITIDNRQATDITVYDTAGRAVGTERGATARFTLPAGIYIATFANHSYKIAIR